MFYSFKHTNMSQTQEFRETVLNQHNMYREKLSVPRLKLCDNLCNFAQEWANKMRDSYRANRRRNPLAHQSGHDYGENLYQCKSKRSLCGKKVVDSWYKEIEEGSDDITKIGHYTQVVWKDSIRLGVGLAIEKDIFFVVCNYDPRGNVVGQFEINVPFWTTE